MANETETSFNEKLEKYIDEKLDADRGSRDREFYTRNELIRAMEYAFTLGQEDQTD